MRQSHRRAGLLAGFALVLVSGFPLLTPSTQLIKSTIVSDPVVVEPRNFVSYKFQVPAAGGTVVGRFHAQGGSGNDIEVVIMDEDGVENFRNGHKVATYYNSGKLTVGKLNVKLDAGTYYLIFNNMFALISNKVVTANIELQSY